MNTITRHIQYLASRHDCVIIPGIGGILATRIPARDLSDGSWASPSRSFTFNASLRHNDGLLACSIARAEEIPYEAAMQLIESEVATMCQQLECDGEYPLGQLGYLSRCLDQDGNSHIDFHPHQADALSVDTFWLPQVYLSMAASTVEADAFNRRDDAPVNTLRFRRLRELARTAAVIVAVFAFYCLVSNPISVDNIVYASLAPEIQKTEVSELLPERDDKVVTRDAESVDGIIVIDEPSDTVDAETAIPILPETKAVDRKSPLPIDEGGDYYVIVASLATYDQALQYLQMPSHQRLNLLEADGRYRIYSTSHPNVTNARRALKDTEDTYPGAWVYHK